MKQMVELYWAELMLPSYITFYTEAKPEAQGILPALKFMQADYQKYQEWVQLKAEFATILNAAGVRVAWERRGLGQTKHLLETILGRSGRIQILDFLMNKSRSQEPMAGLASITEISNHVGLNHTATQDHLKVLGAAGLVQEKKFGRRLRIYRFQRESSLALPLQDFFITWNRRSG